MENIADWYFYHHAPIRAYILIFIFMYLIITNLHTILVGSILCYSAVPSLRLFTNSHLLLPHMPDSVLGFPLAYIMYYITQCKVCQDFFLHNFENFLFCSLK